MKLNVGCGDKKVEGYVNVDVVGNPDKVCDLSTFPWPFEDNSADEIFAEHFLEHVKDFEATILEIHRILKPNGKLCFRVPHFRNAMAPWHLHHWQFSTITCKHLGEACAYSWNSRQLFETDAIRIRFVFINRFNFLWRCLESLANINPFAWDYLGLLIDEIEYTGRKKV
jgi:predicted SAM-dependent methyltransferase